MATDDSQSDKHERSDDTEATKQTMADEPVTEFTDASAATELTGNQPAAPTEITGASEPTEATASEPAVGSRPDPLAAMQPGTVLKDRFRLEEKLGAGAMGAVFRAVDERRVETGHHDPHVAIKLIAGDFAQDSRAFIALQRETDKSQTLAHPNIITVYDFDRDGDVFFMTMESLAGTTLNNYIAAGDGTRKQALGYIDAIANAVAYAHRRNIVHSDLKPENIFVTEEGNIKVLDFGIARAFSAMEGETTAKDPGEIVGLTPTYASCEMFAGEEPHPADDVYALGLIAHELITGIHPFDRTRADQARTDRMKPKKIRGLHGYQWQAIAKALAFERPHRWSNAEAFRRRFTGVGRRVRQLSAALVLAIASFSGYMLLYQPEAGPKIPFEQLPPATQKAFNNALAQGQTARRFGDINGALFYFNKAYELHPRNPRVMEEFDALLDDILGAMKKTASVRQKRAYLEQVKILLQYEALKRNPRLVAKREQLEQQLAAVEGTGNQKS